LPARLKNLNNEELKNIFGGGCCIREGGECEGHLDFAECCEGLTCREVNSIFGKNKICKATSPFPR